MSTNNSNKYISNFVADRKIIFSTVLIILFWTTLYVFFIYKPLYKSSSMVWVKNMTPDTFITELNRDSDLTPLTSAGNPLLTQMEILKSHKLKSLLVDYIEYNYPRMTKGLKDKNSLPDKLIKVDTKTGSDILDITLASDNPVKSKKLLETYLQYYQDLNFDISKEVKADKRKYIDNKLKEVTKKLADIRNKIKNYTADTLAINLDVETNKLVEQKIEFSSQLQTVQASIGNTKGLIRSLERQLSMSPNQAIKAVALGTGNDSLNKLRDELNDTTQEYVFNKVKMSSTNPKIVALKNKINAINNQIKTQIMMTIGKEANKSPITIFDPTREKLVTDLATAQTQLLGLIGQRNSLIKSIREMNRIQSGIPDKRFILNNLQQEENVLSTAYNQLRQKQIEARIKESENLKNIIIIDAPDLPKLAEFPSKSIILLMALVLGSILGFGFSIIKTYREITSNDLSFIKNIVKAPIIGVIPWLKKADKAQNGRLIYDIAYKRIASNIMMKCSKTHSRVLTFTSTSINKSGSPILYNIACHLARLGQSVVLVDADLSYPTINNESNISENVQTPFCELIQQVENKIKMNNTVEASVIMGAVVRDDNNINLLINNSGVAEPSEYWRMTAFNTIIATLKENFDWVLIDTPSLMIAPEFLMISGASNGIILFMDRKIQPNALKKVTALIRDIDIPIIGTIVREQNSEIEKDCIQYTELLQKNIDSTDTPELV